jgi:hypothetical protein
MTGFDSKRQAAQAKLDDDGDTQAYSETLLIVYQRGFADGKAAAKRKPLTNEQISAASKGHMTRNGFARAIEQAHNIKEQP